MSTFLLLRNNQKSGPFSLEEIMGLGIKSNDLIWIEGASSCWKYPNELPDFRKRLSSTVLPVWQSFLQTDMPNADFVRFPAFSLQNHLSSPIPTLAVHGVSESENVSITIAFDESFTREEARSRETLTQEESSTYPIFEDPYWALTIPAFMHGTPYRSISVLERRPAVGGKNIRRSRKKNHHLDLSALITGGPLPVRMPMLSRIPEGGFPIAFA